MELKWNSSRKPRVVIVGAGISGLSAARRLYAASKTSVPFHITVLEASDRVGGRICTSKFSSTGEQIEVGATWIHGIDGSPIHELAQQQGALQQSAEEAPYECMDGFPESPVFKAEGGITVDNAIALPITALYRELMSEVYEQRGAPDGSEGGNLGSFLQKRLAKHVASSSDAELRSDAKLAPWDLKSVQEGVFRVQENWERCVCAVSSLRDLQLPDFAEYWEFPGEQITIAKGFSSITQYMASSLPPGTIQLSKLVRKIVWSRDRSCAPVQLHCDDGCVVDAEHVIVTVSLGVLKAKACEDGELFQPPLPKRKLEAISKLGYGVVDKVFVLMEPLADGAVHPNLQLVHRPEKQASSCPAWLRKTHAIYPIHSSSNVVVAWFAAEEAKMMETLSEEEVAEGVQALLRSFGDARMVSSSSSSSLISRLAPPPTTSMLSRSHCRSCSCCSLAKQRTGSSTRRRTVLTLAACEKPNACSNITA